MSPSALAEASAPRRRRRMRLPRTGLRPQPQRRGAAEPCCGRRRLRRWLRASAGLVGRQELALLRGCGRGRPAAAHPAQD